MAYVPRRIATCGTCDMEVQPPAPSPPVVEALSHRRIATSEMEVQPPAPCPSEVQPPAQADSHRRSMVGGRAEQIYTEAY